MILRTYIRQYPAAKKNQPCTICRHSVLNQPIYWHGYGWSKEYVGKNDTGAATHHGCYWDEKTMGPAPHLTYKQLEAINGAITGKAPPRDMEEANRFLDAVSAALAERKSATFNGDDHAGLKLGPSLVAGYMMVVSRLENLARYLALKDANGTTDWQDPRDRPQVKSQTARDGDKERRLRLAGDYLDQVHRQGKRQSFLTKALAECESSLRREGVEVRWHPEHQRAECRTKQGPWLPIPECQQNRRVCP